MDLGHASFSTLLDRVLNTAADNLRVAKISFKWDSIQTTSPPISCSIG